MQVSYDSTRRRLTFDFGSANYGCTDYWGRRGKIYVDFLGPRWGEAGSLARITTDNYYVHYVNDYRHDVEKTLLYVGRNSAGDRIIRDSVRRHVVTTPNGTIQWSGIREYRQTLGRGPPSQGDDEWFISGEAQGTSRSSYSFSARITDSLKLQRGCQYRFPVKGLTELTSKNLTAILNYDPYGRHDCDRVVVVEREDQEPITITLR